VPAPVTAEVDHLLVGRAARLAFPRDVAARFDTRRVVTSGQRHFRTIRPMQGGVFELLPER
jgi:hypothetical protein